MGSVIERFVRQENIKRPQWAAFRYSIHKRNVACWPDSDFPPRLLSCRYQVTSGHGGRRLPRLDDDVDRGIRPESVAVSGVMLSIPVPIPRTASRP